MSIQNELNSLSNPEKAREWAKYYKMRPGDYGEGAVLLGVSMPQIRKLAKKYSELSFADLQILLTSKIYERKIIALVILVNQYKNNKKKVYDFYLKNTKNINNWGLVDISAYQIVGDYLLDKDSSILHKLSNSNNIWERRIAIVSTYAFIRNNQFGDTLKISEILLNDKHDLIHKAVGWMLREVGKKDQRVLEKFLKKHYKYMPRTMLRYSIERFSEKKRKFYMKK